MNRERKCAHKNMSVILTIRCKAQIDRLSKINNHTHYILTTHAHSHPHPHPQPSTHIHKHKHTQIYT